MVGSGGGGCRVRGSGWGVRVDVNEELKFLGKFTKQIWGMFGRGGGGWVWGYQGRCNREVNFLRKFKK